MIFFNFTQRLSRWLRYLLQLLHYEKSEPDCLQWWISYIEQLHHSAIDLGLTRVQQMAQSLSLTRFGCPVITVAGTNGKGSCIACLESVYSQAGYHVGTYTSPHILEFNERVRFGGVPVSDAQLIAAFDRVERQRVSLGLTLSFFEFTTLAALLIFQEMSPDVVLLEVGLGGRLDAVNVVDSDVAVITSIALDHMDWLGNNRESILFEKMGVAREGSPLVFGEEDPPSNLDELIQKSGAKAYCVGKDFAYSFDHSVLRWQKAHRVVSVVPAVGFKAQNIATALMVIEVLQDRLPVNINQIDAGISKMTLPGRFEILQTHPVMVLDVAHNPAASGWLAQQLSTHFPGANVRAVFGLMKDKDLAATVLPLKSAVKSWYIAGLSPPRGMSSAEIVEKLSALGLNNCYNCESIANSIDAAMRAATHEDANDVLLVFGSFQMVAGAKEYLRNREC